MSKKFQKKIRETLDAYGYEFSTGGLTDVDQLGDNGIEVSMANMSCGYFYPHTDDEVVSYSEVMSTMCMVKELIIKLGETKYKFQKPAGMDFTFGNYYNKGRYNNGYYGGMGNNGVKKDVDTVYIGYSTCPKCHKEEVLWKDSDYEYCLDCGYEKGEEDTDDTIILPATDGCTCNNCGDWITYEGNYLYCSRCNKKYEIKKEDIDGKQGTLFLGDPYDNICPF